MRAITALRCPYCHCGFQPKEEVLRCSQCRTIHHTSCWYENEHCSVYACNGEAYFFFTLPLFIQIATPTLLWLLVLFPDGMSFLAPLLLPALLCGTLMIIGFISHLCRGDLRYVTRHMEYIYFCLLNLITICYTVSKFLKL